MMSIEELKKAVLEVAYSRVYTQAFIDKLPTESIQRILDNANDWNLTELQAKNIDDSIADLRFSFNQGEIKWVD